MNRTPLNCVLAAVLAVFPLTAFGDPTTSAGGSYQKSALSGCAGEWLFNGVWRVRANNVTPVTKEGVDLPGYAVTLNVRNGSHKTTSMAYSGASNPQLVLDDGTVLDLDTDSAILWSQNFNKDLPQSAGFTQTLNYYVSTKGTPVPKAGKLLMEIDPTKEGSSAPRYTTKTPSLRVDLTCAK